MCNLDQDFFIMVNYKRMKITARWYIINILRKRWSRLWLLILVLTIVVFLGNLWMKVHMDIDGTKDSMYSVNQRQLYNHWGKERIDFQWLINYRESRRTDIPMFVVEEHYEVLKYWFQAAEMGIISKSRNVLLHIDGHVDGGFPENAESIPWFRFPRSEEEVHNMMQRNDMFIVSAALTGLIDHVIWVWPTWAASSDQEEEFTHVVFDIYLGLAQVKSTSSNGYDNDLCACLKKRTSSQEVVAVKDEWACRRKNKTVIDMEKGIKINQAECFRQADGILEIVSESLAADVLKKQQWPESKSLLLDIDEDFFGCWSDVIPLYEIGISQENINLLSELVSYLFCATTAEEEQTADDFYASLLSLVKALKSKGCADEGLHKETRCMRNVEIENFIILNLDGVEKFLLEKGISNVMCESGTKVSGLFLQSLMHYLLNFSSKQLTALSELGICLAVSPPSIHFSTSGKFRICHGENIPNKTEVSFYLPEKSEIRFRAIKLRRIMSSLSKRPDLISICRSVRDGYTPKDFFDFIETNVMQSVHTIFRQTHSSNVHYDKNLLGGKTGWTSRSQLLAPKLLQFLGIS